MRWSELLQDILREKAGRDSVDVGSRVLRVRCHSRRIFSNSGLNSRLLGGPEAVLCWGGR